MSTRTTTIEHNGETYYAKVATIESTHLGTEDHGILTAYLHCQGDGWGIWVGGYGLDQPVHDDEGKFVGREPTAYGFDHILQLARTVGVDRWEDLPGKRVLVLSKRPSSLGGTSVGIAHIEDEKRVFILKDHADEWRARSGEAVSA